MEALQRDPETRLELTSVQKWRAQIWRAQIAVRRRQRSRWTEVEPEGLVPLGHSEPHFPPEKWGWNRLRGGAEVLPLCKPLLLFAKSECNALFGVHKPGWFLESSVGAVGGGVLGKHTEVGALPDLLNRNFCEQT